MRNTCNIYCKHLDLSKRNEIEKGLLESKSFIQIGNKINKSPRTVSYEILRNRQCEHCTSWYGKEKICDKTLKPPYVCNACPSRKGCRKTRYYYYAEDAQKEYRVRLSDSRKGIDLTCTEFKHLNETVSNEIKNGHSFAMIIRNHKHEFPVGKRTLYNYVENGYLDIINLDLPRKVRYRKRKHNQTAIPKDTKIRINRTYINFKDYVKEYNDNNFTINIVEMDTVEGIKGESVLLTLLWRNSNFMLAYKLDNKDSESVSNVFDYLKGLLGYETFHMLFPIILTDNGNEFSKPDIIEDNGHHVYKTKLFYCDPGKSGQKGKSFNDFNQDDINLMINHINSVKRDSLFGCNPYELMKNFLPNEIIDLFDIKKIEQKDIILKSKLLNYKNKR